MSQRAARNAGKVKASKKASSSTDTQSVKEPVDNAQIRELQVSLLVVL